MTSTPEAATVHGTENAGEGGYDPAFFDWLFSIEDGHFWFRARNEMITRAVRQKTHGLAPGYRVLEVGCGTGYVLRALEKTCPTALVVGTDFHGEGLSYARRRTKCPLVQSDITQSCFNIPFDLIGIFDCLEHIPDDMQVLRSLYALLKPGGTLLITVPAHRKLWSYFDEASQHCRRYEKKELREKLAAAGFETEFLSPFMAPLFPIMWAKRKLFGRNDPMQRDAIQKKANAELRIVPGLNGLMRLLLKPELLFLSARCSLPFGTSLLAIARKRG